jgi:hypothetical protein
MAESQTPGIKLRVETKADEGKVPRPEAHKIAVGGMAAAFTIVLVWGFTLLTGVEVPIAVAQALTMLGTAIGTFVVPDYMQA